MRTLKLCIMLGVLAALALPAAAVPLDDSQYVGIRSQNREQGNIYDVTGSPDGTYTRVETAGVAKWWLNGIVGGTELPHSAGDGVLPGEDDWGLFWLDEIEVPKNSGFKPYVAPSNAGGVAIIGIFYGLTDDSVTVSTDGSANKQYTLAGGNLLFKLWGVTLPNVVGTQNIQQLYAGLTGIGINIGTSGDRSAADAYDGWTDLPGATLLLSGGMLVPSDAFNFTSTAGKGGFGSSNIWVSVDDNPLAIWNVNWDSNMIPSPLVIPDTSGPPDGSDIYMNWTVAGQFDHGSLKSSDFGNAALIPEPLTMLAIFGSVGLLGGYIRKRRA